MYKFISQVSNIFISFVVIGITFTLPYQWHKIGNYSAIFPALDIAVIFYLSTYKNIYYWQLFVVGIFIDILSNSPLCTTSLALILANILLSLSGKYFMIKEYLTNICVFCVYCAFIFAVRYFVISAKGQYSVDFFGMLFYYMTTILIYPTISYLIEKVTKR